MVQRQPQRALVMQRAFVLSLGLVLQVVGCDGSGSEAGRSTSTDGPPRSAPTAAILTGQRSGLAVVVSSAATAARARDFTAAVGVDATLRWVHVAIYQLDAGESFAFGPERPRLTLHLEGGPTEDTTFGAALTRPEAARTTVPALALETFAGTQLRRGSLVRALAAFDVEVDLGAATGGEFRVGGTVIPLGRGRLDVDGLEDLWEARSREIVVARLAAATAAEPAPR